MSVWDPRTCEDPHARIESEPFDDVEARIAELEAENARLRKEIVSLKSALDWSERELAAARQRIALVHSYARGMDALTDAAARGLEAQAGRRS